MPKAKPKKTTKKSPRRAKKSRAKAVKKVTKARPIKTKVKKEEKKEIKLPVKLGKFLDEAKAKFEPIEHRTVYTTYDAAMTLKVPLNSVAKTLLVKADRDLVLVVVPGNKNLDFKALKKTIKAENSKSGLPTVKSVSLASEKTIEKKFTKSPGALPPFGSLYKLVTYIDRTLQRPKRIVLNGGSFTVSLTMTPNEYLRVSGGKLGSFSKKR